MPTDVAAGRVVPSFSAMKICDADPARADSYATADKLVQLDIGGWPVGSLKDRQHTCRQGRAIGCSAVTQARHGAGLAMPTRLLVAGDALQVVDRVRQ